MMHTTQRSPSQRGHYVPQISRFLVAVLYHEGKRRRMPMTRLVDQLLTDSLRDTPGWATAQQGIVDESTSPHSETR